MPLDKTPTEVTNLVTCGRRCANFKRLLNQTTVGGLVRLPQVPPQVPPQGFEPRVLTVSGI